MRAARRAIAIVSGVLLYCAAAASASKMATAGLPRHWYTALGGRSSLPVALGESLAIALLLCTVAIIWSFATLRPTRRRHRPYVAWLMSGIILAWVGWLIYGAFYFALHPKTYSQPLQSLLLSSNAAPLFGIFNIVGVLCGAYLGGVIAKKVQMGLPSSRTQRRAADALAEAEPVSQQSEAPPESTPPAALKT